MTSSKIVIHLTQDPYPTSGTVRLPTTDGDASIYVINGDWYEAAAEDASGNLYTVYWCPDNMDDPDACDWSTPAAIVSMCPWRDVTISAVIDDINA